MVAFLAGLGSYPAFWGLCGGLLGGAVGLTTAYSSRAGNVLARRKAWMGLGLGVLGGPMLAEVFTVGLQAASPIIGSRGIALMLGVMCAQDPTGLFRILRSVLLATLDQLTKAMREGQNHDRP